MFKTIVILWHEDACIHHLDQVAEDHEAQCYCRQPHSHPSLPQIVAHIVKTHVQHRITRTIMHLQVLNIVTNLINSDTPYTCDTRHANQQGTDESEPSSQPVVFEG